MRENIYNATARTYAKGLTNWCKFAAIFVPLLACACPRLPLVDGGETVTWPRTPVEDPAMWMQLAAEQECPRNERQQYAPSNDRQFGGVQLIYNPCGSGTNLTYIVFYNISGHAGERKFCAIGMVGGSGVSQLPSGRNGFVRIETYWHWSAYEGDLTQYELRPNGLVRIGKVRRVVQKPN